MRKRSDARLLAGLILLVVGAAGFTYGVVTWNQAHAALRDTLQRIMTGTTAAESQAIVVMIAGAAVAAIGIVLLAIPRRR